jgi:hypothetical protein
MTRRALLAGGGLGTHDFAVIKGIALHDRAFAHERRSTTWTT